MAQVINRIAGLRTSAKNRKRGQSVEREKRDTELTYSKMPITHIRIDEFQNSFIYSLESCERIILTREHFHNSAH